MRIDKEQGSARYRRSTLIRQRQTVTHFIDQIEESSFKNLNQFRLALKESGKLFRYNLGPEGKGFMLCPKCGCSEPLRGYKTGKPHQRLRPIAGSMKCNNDHPWGVKAIAYGHEFQSFCLVARPITPPGSVESLAYALQRGLCKALDIEPSDIGVSWRWLANKEERTGSEIILYDRTPGGAGFVKEGWDHWNEVVEESRRICESCRCENACYDCLKDYGNQTHHEKLDRRTVLQFISGGG